LLVVDASTAIRACLNRDGFAPFGSERLIAPPLMWSEFRSGLHRVMWYGGVGRSVAETALSRLEHSSIEERRHRKLGRESWRIADELGWPKTYDAEYLALAFLVGARLVTADLGLRRAAERLGVAADPSRLG
jgi:predicted nucleic acid-binding protein